MSNQENNKSILNEYKMSELMLKLNQGATKKARSIVASKYSNSGDLDELSNHISQLQKELSLAESQLNVSVNGKLDALKKAKDIMDLSSKKLSSFQSSLHDIDNKITSSNTIISNYEYLKRANNAEENISKVKSQVEFFAKVPDRVKELLQLLDDNIINLKEVYLEAIKLESLRETLLLGIKLSRDRRMTEITPYTTHKISPIGKSFGGASEYSESSYISIKTAVDKHLGRGLNLFCIL